MRILIIEDNPKLAAALQRGLQEQGYRADVCPTGFEGEELAADGEYDVVVLDLMLPDRDGIDVCRCLRRRGVSTPILVLTALSKLRDKVTGLDAGADDYLTKPFELEELLARVRALLRRGQATEATRLVCADLELDLLRRSAQRAGTNIRLSAKEFSLLEFLMRNQDRVLGRTVIAEEVWDIHTTPSSNLIDVYISNLRKKVDRGFDPPLIHTAIGVGYRFGEPEQVPGDEDEVRS